MARCGECQNKLGSQNDFVICTGCSGKYHYQCAKISFSTWSGKSQKKKEEWRCPIKCRKNDKKNKEKSNQVDVNEHLDVNEHSEDDENDQEADQNTLEDKTSQQEKPQLKLADQIGGKSDSEILRMICKKLDDMEETKNEVKSIVTSLNFLYKKHEEVEKENKTLKISVKEMEKRITILEEKKAEQEKFIEDLKQGTNEKDQYERNRNLEINQLDWLPEEKIPDVVERLAHAFGVTFFKHEMVDAAHRLPNKNKSKPSTLLLQFKHRDCRDAWLQAKKKIVTNNNIYNNGNGNRIYLNENMTPYYRDLFWKVRKHAKEKGFKFVWFLRGKIMVKKNESDRDVFIVRKESDLTQLS